MITISWASTSVAQPTPTWDTRIRPAQWFKLWTDDDTEEVRQENSLIRNKANFEYILSQQRFGVASPDTERNSCFLIFLQLDVGILK